MIYVFSNRNIINNNSLGDGFNSESNENIRVAKYVAGTQKDLQFYNEEEGQPLPSVRAFEELQDSSAPCCIFIHGFNQNLEKNLDKCREIEAYGVNVIAFSWPSNPGPQAWWWKIKEYKSARQNARRSVVALERFFDKINDYATQRGKKSNIKSLVVHSLGNYLLESFVSSKGFDEQTAVLDNILLHQADVDSFGHEEWADKLAAKSRVMVTVNETDDVLDFSDVLNPDRLGNTLGNLRSKSISYFNFGQLDLADDVHRLWQGRTIRNESAKLLFTQAFAGKKVRTGHFEYDTQRNCFHVR